MKIYVEEAVFSLFPFLTLFCLKACFDPALPLGEEKEERLKKELECAEKRAHLREEKHILDRRRIGHYHGKAVNAYT